MLRMFSKHAQAVWSWLKALLRLAVDLFFDSIAGKETREMVFFFFLGYILCIPFQIFIRSPLPR